MSALPPAAVAAVSRIEALLEQARRLGVGAGDADEVSFALAETGRRYLPDTVDAYLAIPISQRDGTADGMLVEQLTVLERATTQRLATLGEARRTSLAANGSFLTERFGELATLPEANVVPGVVDSVAPPTTLVRRFFTDLDRTAMEDPRSLVAVAAERFGALLPALTTVKRGLFGGPPKAVAIDVPVGNDALRYALEAGRAGVETSCTKIVRGIALRTERCEVDEWLRALFEDVQAYVERDRSTRDRLATFFRS